MHFFQLFCTKNAENEDFDQRLGCAAPKPWSKYTTNQLLHLQILGFLDLFISIIQILDSVWACVPQTFPDSCWHLLLPNNAITTSMDYSIKYFACPFRHI